jgi:hypothetical protein
MSGSRQCSFVAHLNASMSRVTYDQALISCSPIRFTDPLSAMVDRLQHVAIILRA